MSAPPAPSGTITYLFTDIERSTRLWQAQPRAMAGPAARVEALLKVDQREGQL